MRDELVISPGSDDVVPKLPTFLVRPGIRTLVNRDHELRRFLEKLDQFGFGCFHFTSFCLFWSANLFLEFPVVVPLNQKPRVRFLPFQLTYDM